MTFLGIYAIAAAVVLGLMIVLWAISLILEDAGFSPIITTELLTRVSGVSLLEESLRDTKPGYREYIETTSPFFPWVLRVERRPR